MNSVTQTNFLFHFQNWDLFRGKLPSGSLVNHFNEREALLLYESFLLIQVILLERYWLSQGEAQ